MPLKVLVMDTEKAAPAQMLSNLSKKKKEAWEE